MRRSAKRAARSSCAWTRIPLTRPITSAVPGDAARNRRGERRRSGPDEAPRLSGDAPSRRPTTRRSRAAARVFTTRITRAGPTPSRTAAGANRRCSKSVCSTKNLVRNQDDELNLRLCRAGGRIWQSPAIVSWYQPRASLRRLVPAILPVRILEGGGDPEAPDSGLTGGIWRLPPGRVRVCLLAVVSAADIVSRVWAAMLAVYARRDCRREPPLRRAGMAGVCFPSCRWSSSPITSLTARASWPV